MKMRMMLFALALPLGLCAVPFHPSVDAALDQAHGLLTEKFLSEDGLLLDYLGEIPTPRDCAECRPNAMGWWCPIENGPMFTGPYLAAMCERARRTEAEADRELCRRMSRGLLKAASVSPVKGMVVRGFGTDGTCHFPLGSEDQTVPWFFGLHAYAQSGIPSADERKAVVAKMREVADALEANDWKCPCDGRFTGENRGDFKSEKGLLFRGDSHYLFILRAMFDVTGDETWNKRYLKACAEKHPQRGDMTRLDVCSKGYEVDLGQFPVETVGMWIYVCAQGCLRELAKMDRDWKRRSFFFKGLQANARRAAKFFGEAEKYDNSTERPFRYGNWRTGYRWEEQTTQEVANRVANSGDKRILGQRKEFERAGMTAPLSCCAVVGYAGNATDRAAIAGVIRRYDYSTLNICEFFLAEVAWYALPEPERKEPVLVRTPDPRRLFLCDREEVRPAPSLGNSLTAEIVFVPQADELLPKGVRTGNGRALLNVGSGYFAGFRLVASESPSGLLLPGFNAGRSQGAVSFSGTRPIVPGATNQVILVWNGSEARFWVNGRDAGRGPCEAPWTFPETSFVGFGFMGYGLDPLAQNILRVRIWNRPLTDDEVAGESIYAKLPRPAEMDLLDKLIESSQGYLDASFCDSASLARQAGDVSRFHPAVRRLYDRVRDELLVREGKKAFPWGAIADDDGKPRHRPVPPTPEPGAKVFVSPTGDDAASGAFERPLKTLAAAQRKVREIRRAGLPQGGVAVCLRGGTYPVSGTLALTAEDSGEPGRPIVWRAWEDERPVLDGGFAVPPLAVVTDAKALARLPASAHGKVLSADLRSVGYNAFAPLAPYGFQIKGADQRYVDLYCDGKALALARQPNDGWYEIGDVPKAGGRTFRAKDVPDLSPWTKEREPELMALGYWKFFWADETVEVDAVDPKTGLVTIRNRGGYTEPVTGKTFRFVNALAAVDEPGEWFLDRREGRLYVYPPKEATGDSRYVLSRFGEAFISLTGAHDVRLEGLVLQHGRRHAVTVNNVSGLVFAGNVVRRFGGMGMLAENVRGTQVSDNVFHTFGLTACDMSSGDRKTLTAGGLVVANNEFSDTGRAQRTYTPGLRANGVGIEIVHNHFHDIPSSAMAPGGNDHYIGWNLVERVVTESDDQGGIDMFGHTDWAGIRMAWNVWRDIGGCGDQRFVAGRAGIRLDDAISGMYIYGNRFIDCSRGHFGGVQVHAGRFNEIENNLFVGGEAGISFSSWGPDGWKAYFGRGYIQDWLTKDVNVNAEPYLSRYPHMRGLADAPMTNWVSRNVFAAVGKVFRQPQTAAGYAGNVRCDSPEAAERAFVGSKFLRPLPPLASVGSYESTPRTRARRNDGAERGR